MNFRQAIEAVKASLKLPTGRTHDLDAKEAINLARKSCAALKAWPFMIREAATRNEGGYRDALVTVTQNSLTGTVTTGTLPSNCAGWHFMPQSGNTERYKIATRDSGTEFTLDRPYEGDTKTGLACIIWDPYCTAPQDLYRWKSIRFEYGGYTVDYEDGEWFDRFWADPRNLGNGVELVTHAEPSTSAEQTTGTVTVTKGSATVTLSGATWPTWAANHHLRFQGEPALYRVLTRDSTTQVTLDRKYGGVFAGAGIAYELDPPGALVLEVVGPMEDQYALKIRYFAEPQDLMHDQDQLEGFQTYQECVIEYARADFLMRNMPDPGAEGNSPQFMRVMNRARSHEKNAERLKDGLLGNYVAPTGPAQMRLQHRMLQGRR